MSDRIITETVCGVTIRRRVVPTSLNGPWVDFLVEESRWCDAFGRKVLGPMLAAQEERIDKLFEEVADE